MLNKGGENMMAKKRSLIYVIILCLLMYLMYGIYFTVIGADSNIMMGFFGITESEQGFIMTIQSIGCLIMVILLGLFGERINKLHGLLAGLIIWGAAGILIGSMTLYTQQGTGYGLMLTFALIGGVGYIMIDLLMNGVIADIYPEKKEKVLPYVHAFYGLGAMLAPMLVTALTDENEVKTFALPYLILGIAVIVIALFFAIASHKAMPATPYADMSEIKKRAVSNPAEVFKEGKAWLYLASCFAYLLFQNGLVVWAPSYFKTVNNMTEAAGNNMLTIYFLGCLIIRLLSPLVYKFISVRKFYITATLLSAFSFGAVLLVQPLILKYIFIFITGLLQGSAVPGMVVMCCNAFPKRTASASSIVVFGVSASSLIAPPLIGAVIEAAGYSIPMWGMTACLVISVLILLRSGKGSDNA